MTTAVESSWRSLLIDRELAKQYNTFSMIFGGVGFNYASNPILDRLLPSLISVKALAVLDEALVAFLDSKGIDARAYGQREDLNGRIVTAEKAGFIRNGAVLHFARKRRNELAHESDTHAPWNECDTIVDAIQKFLEEQGLVEPMPKFDVGGGRSAAPNDVLRPPGVLGHVDEWLTLSANGETVVRFERRTPINLPNVDSAT